MLAGQANRAWNASGRFKSHFAGRANRTGVRRCPPEVIDPDRASVRDECPRHSGKLESCLIVAEFAAAQPDRSLRLRLCNRPTQLKRDRERTRGMTTGDGKHGIGEASV